MTDWFASLLNLPAEYLKTAGTVLGGAFLAVGTYVLARIKEGRRPPEERGPPRISLDPADRDLGFTLVRCTTDLTRALNEHADALASLPAPGCAAPHPPAPVHRARTRRPQP